VEEDYECKTVCEGEAAAQGSSPFNTEFKCASTASLQVLTIKSLIRVPFTHHKAWGVPAPIYANSLLTVTTEWKKKNVTTDGAK
jgi:hypothetical protein